MVEIALGSSDAHGNGSPIRAEELTGLAGVNEVQVSGNDVTLAVSHPHIALPRLLERLGSRASDLTRLSIRHASLEDVFVKLTGRHLRDNEATP